jgi:hypothetical protein
MVSALALAAVPIAMPGATLAGGGAAGTRLASTVPAMELPATRSTDGGPLLAGMLHAGTARTGIGQSGAIGLGIAADEEYALTHLAGASDSVEVAGVQGDATAAQPLAGDDAMPSSRSTSGGRGLHGLLNAATRATGVGPGGIGKGISAYNAER